MADEKPPGYININGRTAWTIRAAEVVSSIVLAVLASYIYLDNRYDDIERSLIRIESNRFTSGDGADVWQAIAELDSRMAAMPSEVPPAWFQRQVQDLELRMRALENKQQ